MEEKELLLEEDESRPRRRDFLTKLLTVMAGLLASLVPILSGIAAAVDPLRRKRGGGGVPYVKVTSLAAVPADGRPRMFRVIADKTDAWNRFLDVPVGAVYLRRPPESPDTVIAFNTVCPHLGCFVEAADDGTYRCPCHNSRFNADGSRGDPCVAARGLDELETEVKGNEILVRFQSFQSGKEQKIPI